MRGLARVRARIAWWWRGYWHARGWESIEGECNICGQPTRFLYTDLRMARESLVCARCGSTSRYRSMARGILAALARMPGIEARSIARLPRELPGAKVRVLDTQVPFYTGSSAYPIPDLLSRCAWIDVCCTILRPGLPLGTRLGRRISNENLERLTFASESFDLVLTSDVLEHVRLDALAHAEIARILKPGGTYLFTVPHGRSLPSTIQRVVVHDPGDPRLDEFVMEPEYHGDVNNRARRALAYRVYGPDLDAKLEQLGLHLVYEKRDAERNGILNTELFTCRKTESGDSRLRS